jgi:hypothetical protein
LIQCNLIFVVVVLAKEFILNASSNRYTVHSGFLSVTTVYWWPALGPPKAGPLGQKWKAGRGHCGYLLATRHLSALLQKRRQKTTTGKN